MRKEYNFSDMEVVRSKYWKMMKDGYTVNVYRGSKLIKQEKMMNDQTQGEQLVLPQEPQVVQPVQPVIEKKEMKKTGKKRGRPLGWRKNKDGKKKK